MKKTASIIALFLLLAAGILLTGCSKTDGNTLPDSTASASPSPTSSETAPAEQPPETEAAVTADQTPAAGTIVTKEYASGGIIIDYPQLASFPDGDALDQVNRLMEDGALRDLEFITNTGENVTYELDYTVTYFSSDFISIRFDGYSYFEGAAHPNSFLFSVNVDLTSQTVICLSDLVQIGNSFVDVFKTGTYSSDFFTITPDISEAIDLEINAFDEDEWANRFNSSDKDGTENYGSVYSYLTESDLILSIPVPQVLGGHVEIMIPYSDLSDLKTQAQIWAEVLS